MKSAFNFRDELIKAGFESNTNEWGAEVLSRTDKKMVEVAWYGERESVLTVVVRFNLSQTDVHVDYYDGAKRPFKTKSYQANKRTYNAIAETMRLKGWEL